MESNIFDNVSQKKTSSFSFILTLYFILKPIYLFDSGLPQICDLLLFTTALYIVVKEKFIVEIPGNTKNWIYFFFSICAYQFFVDYIWFGITDDKGMIIKAVQYVFNFTAAMVCIWIANNDGIDNVKKAICNGCFYSVIITGVGLLLGSGRNYRATGFFNNPNQLGYYAIIMITIVVLFPNELTRVKNTIIIVISIYANFLSLSKASVIGTMGLMFFYVLFAQRGTDLKTVGKKMLLIILVMILFYIFLYSRIPLIAHNNTISIMRERIMNMANESDSALGSGRGYDRIFEMGWHYLWGMGEGAFWRFKTLVNAEVHSTYINMFVSYGIIGLIGYVYLFGKALFSGHDKIKTLACMSGIFLYFLSHNGIRSTLLWILLALLLVDHSKNIYENLD